MAVRIRQDGRILCAALNLPEPGDTYIPDDLHQRLSADERLLVTALIDEHMITGGEWWWVGQVRDGRAPTGQVIDPYYLETPG